MDQRSRDRDRRPLHGGGGGGRNRGDRGDRDRSPVGGGGGGGGGKREKYSVFVSNIPFECTWTDLKDLFRNKVGDVARVDFFPDENGAVKNKGSAMIRFNSREMALKAIEVMNKHELEGRKLVVRNDPKMERKFELMTNPTSYNDDNRSRNDNRKEVDYNTYGLSLKFLDSLEIKVPLAKSVFVSSLDYNVNESKLKEVFKLAGKVVNIDLPLDNDGKIKGFAIIEYSHPVEAVQAISMFNQQYLFDHKMRVRMDALASEKSAERRLPKGLQGIGPGLGANGEPMRDIAKVLAENTSPDYGMGILGPGPVATSMNTVNPVPAPMSLQNLGIPNLNQLLNNSQLIQQALANNSMMSSMIGSNNDLSSINQLQSSGNSPNNYQSFSNQMGRNRSNNDSIPSLMSTQVTNPKTTLITVSGLPLNIGQGTLRDKFLEAGDVTFVEKIDATSAIICFRDERSVSRAIDLFDQTRVQGHNISVRTMRT